MYSKNANTDLLLLGFFDLPPIGFCNEFLLGGKYDGDFAIVGGSERETKKL